MAHSSVPGPSCKSLVPSMEEADKFDPRICIICQERSKTPVTSEKTGRERLKRAAMIRNDDVAKRLKTMVDEQDDGEDSDNLAFVYHNTNKCYKSYTHSGKLKAIEAKAAAVEDQSIEQESQKTKATEQRKSLRGNAAKLEPPSSDKDPNKLPCVICGKIKHKDSRMKYRFCEYESATKFIGAARHNQDDVFTRIADRLLDNEDASVKCVVSADLYYHNLCLQNYLRRYERSTASQKDTTTSINNMKRELFTRAIPFIDALLAKGHCCTMSDIAAFAQSLLEDGEVLTSTFQNRDMKHLIISHYGDSVTISANTKATESDIFFSSGITAADLAIKLRNQNIMREAGAKLREVLLDVDFGLQDSFCDSTDLKDSWESTVMPAPLLTFLSALYKIPQHKLYRSSVAELEDLLEPPEEEEDVTKDDQLPQPPPSASEQAPPQQPAVSTDHGETTKRNHKATQLHCLFQMLVYTIHNGVKRTPLHLMLGHSLYARDRSKSLLTVFNRIGACASYQSVRSARSLLASYAVKCSEHGETPLPSTFNTSDYTMAGMDNSDYADKSSLSGTEGSHYAALVLFQDDTINRPRTKPSVSSTGLSSADSILKTKLPCQDIPPHVKPATRPTLPDDMIMHPENKQVSLLDMQTARNAALETEFLISLIRLGEADKRHHIWAAVHTLVSSAAVPLMRVGFLPVIPRPITERATVRQCLANFQSVRRQLGQTSMAVWCDEGVFAPALDIYLHETEEFKDLFLCLGPFHWTRVLLRCQGKLLRGSGPDDALIECAVFGPGVIESALNGSHYVRAVTGMLIVEDLIRTLQWQAFWQHNDKGEYPDLVDVEELRTTLASNQRCPEKFKSLLGKTTKLRQDFMEFEKECEAKSEVCKFFGVWLNFVTVIKNMIVSDREGNWSLHVSSVEDSMPIFAECDCINYLRHGSWYLEQIKVLEFTHPELYRRFAMGQWVVQDRPGWFCAVGGDMKVEQTIQRVSKGPGGHYVVGSTRNASAVAEFELLFHEIGSITNLLNSLTTNRSMKHTDCHIQHAISPTRRLKFNENVEKLLNFVLERQNPYAVTTSGPVPLHNLLTKLAVDSQVKTRLLNCLENGEKTYRSYRQERFVDKMKKISAIIPKSKLPRFTDVSQKAPAAVEKNDITPKDVAAAQRNMDIAKERGMSVQEILGHNILPNSPLFDGDIPAQVNKSPLVGEVESRLDPTQWCFETNLATHVVVDFMSKMRQMPLNQFPSLGAAIDAVITSTSHLSQEAQFTHLVLDSYLQMSVKEGERARRSNPASGIKIIGMNRATPVPQQLEKFWASVDNKRELQQLVRDMVRTGVHGTSTIIVSSVVSDEEVLPAIISGGEEIPDLLSWIEEADARLVVHVDWAVRIKQCKRIVIVSNDTDTFALMLHYFSHFQSLGLQEMWQQYGTGEKRRMLPLHEAVPKLGTPLAKVVIKAHILTGDDSMSKVGTKHAAILCDPVQYLTNFGEDDTLSEQDIVLAERYLVRVWTGTRSATPAQTFDQLRVEKFTGGNTGIDSLPPTSSVIRGHIHRGGFLAYKACHLLSTARDHFPDLDPLKHGWLDTLGMLLPSKCLKPLPAAVTTVCKCAGKCDTRRCVCRQAGLPCVLFCHGWKESSCTNKPRNN